MIAIIGLIILVAAVVVGVAGVLGNVGSAHGLASNSFTVFGYHVTGSTGALFLSGIVIGAVAMMGLSLLLAGYSRAARRGKAARLGLEEARRRTAAVSHDRDDLIVQRETEAAQSKRAHSSAAGDDGHHRRRHLFGTTKPTGSRSDEARTTISIRSPRAAQPEWCERLPDAAPTLRKAACSST